MFQLQSLSDNIHQKEVKVYKSCMQRNILLLLFPLVLSNISVLIGMHSSAVCASQALSSFGMHGNEVLHSNSLISRFLDWQMMCHTETIIHVCACSRNQYVLTITMFVHRYTDVMQHQLHAFCHISDAPHRNSHSIETYVVNFSRYSEF